MLEHLAITIEDFALGDEAHIFAVLIDDRQVPSARIIKGAHHFFHGCANSDSSRRLRHETLDIDASVQVGTEHDVAYVVKQHDANECAIVRNDRKEVAVALGNDIDHVLTQFSQ